MLAARRRELSAQTRMAGDRARTAALLPLLQGRRCAAYVSGGDEPGTAALLAPGVLLPVLLPVLLADGDLDWAEHDGSWTTGRHGLREPAGRRLGRDAIAGAEVVLVPALAVDRAGNRLGRGGGSYDRALTRASGRTVALLHDGELLDALPVEPHDVAVRACATPALGLVDLGDG